MYLMLMVYFFFFSATAPCTAQWSGDCSKTEISERPDVCLMVLFQYCCTLYDLVTFHAGDVAPAPAATCTMPTNSIHEIISQMEKLE